MPFKAIFIFFNSKSQDYNKKNQIHVLKTSTEISGFAFFSNNPNNFVTLLYTYFSQQNHEILSIFKYFLEAELKS